MKTSEDREVLILARRSEYLMIDARRPDEPDLHVFGIPVSTMNQEQLLAVIYRQARLLQEHDPYYCPGLGEPCCTNPKE